MTIDDELLLEIIKPNSDGKAGEDSLFAKIIGQKEIRYRLEHSETLSEKVGSGRGTRFEPLRMTPDIVVHIADSTVSARGTQDGVLLIGTTPSVDIAIEIENDIQWDFQESLRQLKKYKRKYPDTRVIIPEDYRRFAPLYKNEEFRVYLWKAKRVWQCLRCGAETLKEGTVTPKCSNSDCDNHSPNEFRLIGLKDTIIEEFNAPA